MTKLGLRLPRLGLHFFLALVVFCGVVVLQWIPMHFGVDTHHDGVMIKPALDVAHGAKLFKETFTHYGPISTYLNAAAVYAFGDTVASIRIATLLSYAFTWTFLFLALARFVSAPIALLASFSQFLMVGALNLPWASVHSNLLAAIGLYLFCLWATTSLRKNAPLLLFSGMSFGLVFWTRQSTGLAILVATFVFALAIWLTRQTALRFKELGYFIAGLVLGFTSFGVLYQLTNFHPRLRRGPFPM